jgi:hypothetical protein
MEMRSGLSFGVPIELGQSLVKVVSEFKMTPFGLGMKIAWVRIIEIPS